MNRYLPKGLFLSVTSFAITTILIYFLLLIGLHLETSGHAGVWKKLIQGKINADILFTGDSRSLSHIDCAIVESAIKDRSCFNIGLNGSGLNLQLPYIKTYLKYNRKPKIIVHDVSFLSVQRSTGIDTPDQYVLYLGEEDIYNTLVSLDHNFWNIKYIPTYEFFAYGRILVGRALQGYLDYFGFVSKGSRITDKEVNRIKGYWPRDIKWNDHFERYKAKHPNGRTVEIEKGAIDDLKAIIELARSNGIAFILVYPPEYYENYALTLNRDKILEAFKSAAEQYDVPFWDYSGTPLTKDTRYFYNSQHMNKLGAEEFSRQISQRLKNYMTENNL